MRLTAIFPSFHFFVEISPTDVGVKMEKFPGVIKGRFYVSAPLNDSWEAFTPSHAGDTVGIFYTSW